MFTSQAIARPLGTDDELANLVAQGARHAAAAFTSPFALPFDALQTIELPPGAEAHVDRAQLRALAALYLAADLEPAGVFTSAEELAGLTASGALRVNLGPATELLHTFWRARHERVNAEDRLAFFGRLFGAAYGAPSAEGANNSFETLMLELCESLYQLGEGLHSSRHGGIALQTRIRGSARNLLNNLVAAGGGATPFMAREVMAGLQQALDILKQPQLQGVLGARDIWGVVNALSKLAQRPGAVNPQVFVRRGRAGMMIITWLADALGALRIYGAPLVEIDHPIIGAAVDWLQATLTISEMQVRAQPQPTPSGGVSDWADLGI